VIADLALDRREAFVDRAPGLAHQQREQTLVVGPDPRWRFEQLVETDPRGRV